jgi:hypothetical protein
MANFAVANSTNFLAQAAVGTTYVPVALVSASTAGTSYNSNAGTTYPALRRGKLYDLLVGTNGTPGDTAVEWTIQRCTVGTCLAWVGAVSSVSSTFALDQADNGFGSFSMISASNPSSTIMTVTGNSPWYVGVNQRASYRWVAAPGSEIVWPAVSTGTGGGGLSLSVRSPGYTGTPTGTIFFQEQ